MADITTHQGYMARFWEIVPEKQQFRDPMRQAYICVERELFAAHGRRRYLTYESFKTGKWKRPVRIRFAAVLAGHPKTTDVVIL